VVFLVQGEQRSECGMGSESAVLAGTRANRRKQIREALLDQMWKGLCIAALLGAPASASRALFTGWLHLYTFHVVLALVIVVVHACRSRMPFGVKATGLILILSCVGVAAVFRSGLLGLGLWWLLLSSLVAGLLFSIRWGIVLAVVTCCIVVAAGVGFVTGILTMPFDANAYLAQPSSWATLLFAGALMPLFVFQAIAVYQKAMSDLLEEVGRQHDQQTILVAQAVAEIKTMRGVIAICAQCKKIRNDMGYWEQLEAYLEDHSEAQFTHSLCHPCGEALYGALWRTAMRRRESDPGPS
jgi:hypothetical protein